MLSEFASQLGGVLLQSKIRGHGARTDVHFRPGQPLFVSLGVRIHACPLGNSNSPRLPLVVPYILPHFELNLHQMPNENGDH